MSKHSQAREEVEAFLIKMTEAWNAHQLDAFTACYHKSPETLLIAQGKALRGWDAIHDLYRSIFEQSDSLGHLLTDAQFIDVCDASNAIACTEWKLDAEGNTVTGYATVQLKKIADTWLVTHDHSSYLE